MHSFQKLAREIKEIGWDCQYDPNNGLLISRDFTDFDGSYWAIINIVDTSIMGGDNSQDYICELDDGLRNEKLEAYLDDPWEWGNHPIWSRY